MRRRGTGGWLLHDLKHRGVTAWALFLVLTAFYVALYFTEAFTPFATETLGLPHKWTFYGLLYTVAIAVGGAWVIAKYRHNRYQIVRTVVVIVVQVSLAFSVPLILRLFEQPEYYFSYLWPLDIKNFYPSTIAAQPVLIVLYSFMAALVLMPILTILYGKRWYCSWVCGCGGLANTAGEPFRHLSSKSSTAWKLEKVAIYSVVVLAVVTTALAVLSALLPEDAALSGPAGELRHWYGLVVGVGLSGIAGVALYPLGGTRVWCRYFCPMAGMLGLIQKFGRFRIRVKQNMCISCGLCSEYCEMGIDVRSYAQANESFTRAACVGCGLCAEVCPRGVLRLENVNRKDPQEAKLAPWAKDHWRDSFYPPLPR
jgi:ferredoxin-type protein NapH